MKKHYRWILIASVFALAAAGVAAFALAADSSCAHAVAVKGTVQRRATEAGKWTTLKTGAGLRAGEWVSTGTRSQADLVILKRYRVRLSECTTIRIPQDTLAGHVHAIYLSTGRIWAQVFGGGQAETRFEVETDAAVAGVRGTVFSVSQDQETTTVSVYEGRVAVSNRNRDETVLLEAGTQTTIKPGRGPSKAMPLTPSEKGQWKKVTQWIQKDKGTNSSNKGKNQDEEEAPGEEHGAKGGVQGRPD